MCMYIFFFPESDLIALGASPLSQEEADTAKKLSHVWLRVTITIALPSKNGIECCGEEVWGSPLKDHWHNSPWSEWDGRIRGWLWSRYLKSRVLKVKQAVISNNEAGPVKWRK